MEPLGWMPLNANKPSNRLEVGLKTIRVNAFPYLIKPRVISSIANSTANNAIILKLPPVFNIVASA